MPGQQRGPKLAIEESLNTAYLLFSKEFANDVENPNMYCTSAYDGADISRVMYSSSVKRDAML
jgi:hypothetical protein